MSFIKTGIDRRAYDINRVISFKILVMVLAMIIPAVRVFMGEPDSYSITAQNIYAIYALFCTLLFHYSFNLVVRAGVLHTGVLLIYPIAYVMFRQAMTLESAPIFYAVIFAVELLFMHPSNIAIPRFFIKGAQQEIESN